MSGLEAEIAQGRVSPVYVLSVDEPLIAQRLCAALLSAVVPAAMRAFNHEVIEAGTSSGGAIASATRTIPMLGGKRLIVVRDADALGAEGLDALRPCLENPSPQTVLVLLCAKVDGRLKFFAEAKKRSFLFELSAPKQVVPWIQEEARRAGVALKPDAVRRLADVVGKDLGRLASCLEQLSLYAGERAVTAEDVDELVAETRESTVFELANAIGEGRREAALRAIGKLFDQKESSVGVAMMLARHFRQLALAKEAASERVPSHELPRRIGAPPFAVDGLMKQARRLPPQSFSLAFGLLAKADRELKSSTKAALGERILVERLALALLDLGE